MALQDVNIKKVAQDILIEFLEVAFHNILYVRGIYAAGIFERRKKYNVPVQMSCQPDVNHYIHDLLHSLRTLLESGTVEKISFVILNKSHEPCERFVFELETTQSDAKTASCDNFLTRMEQALRAFLLKLTISDSLLRPLPTGCSWTIQLHAMEADILSMQEKQLIQDFTWVMADRKETEMKDALLTPLKAMDSTIMKMQLYVEESGEKEQTRPTDGT